MSIVGLKYLGSKEEGIKVMLYRSYKTIHLTNSESYEFSDRDNKSAEAHNYYNTLSNLGVQVLLEGQLTQSSSTELPIEVPTTVVDKVLLEGQLTQSSSTELPIEVPTTVVDKVSTEEVPTTVVDKVSTEEVIQTPVPVADMTDAELSEYLEMNYSKDQLKSLCQSIAPDYNVSRKSEANMINELMINHKSELISQLSK